MKHVFYSIFTNKEGHRLSSVFVKFVLSYTILALLITFTIGTTAYILSKNNYNREIEALNVNIHNQYKRILESQIIENVESAWLELNTMPKVNKFYYGSTINPSEIHSIYKDMKKIVTKYNTCISNIHLYNSKDNIIISTLYGLNYLYQYTERIEDMYPWYSQIEQINNNESKWLMPETPVADPTNQTVVSVLFPYPCSDKSEINQSYLIIDVKQTYLQNIIDDLATNNQQLMVVNDQGYIIAAGNDILWGLSLKDLGYDHSISLNDCNSGGFSIVKGDYTYYTTYSKPSNNGWRLIQMTPVTLFYASSYRMRNIIILICISSIIIGFIVSYVLSYKMYMPIKTLSNMFKQTNSEKRRINEFELITKQIGCINKQISELNVRMEEYMPMIKYNLVMKIISGTIHSEDELWERLQLINNSFLGRYFNVLLIKLDKQLIEELVQKNIELLKVDLCRRIEYISNNDTIFIASEIRENELVALVFTMHQNIGILLKDMIDSIRRDYGLHITISLGTWKSSPMNLNTSYKAACNAQKYRFMHPDQSAFFAETLPTEIPDDCTLKLVVDQFGKALNLGNVRECENHIHSFAKLLRSADYPYEYCHDNIVRLIELFTNYSEKLNISDCEAAKIDFSGFSDINEFEIRFIEALNNLFALRYNKTKDKQIEIIECVKEYISNNLSGDLSLYSLASYVHLSSSYLSRSFKEIVGINLTDYITNLRMEQARKMIEQSRIDIQDIAKKVGYFTPHYFSRKFKEFYGYTPKDYRYIVQNNK